VNGQARRGLASHRSNLFPVSFEQMKDLNGCVSCLASCSLGAFQKKVDPFFPDSLRSDALKKIVVTLAVSFEIKTQVQKGLAQYAFGAKKQRA
jgi:hypothetical protein